MSNLTPSDLKEIENRINDGIEEYSIKTLSGDRRTHLGISEIGEPCQRKLYYKFRWVKDEVFSGRMLRLFRRGHREEERFINYLEGIGCTVKRLDENGKQFRALGFMGHYGGSCDGQVITPWVPDNFLLELKTHNTKSFVDYLNKGLQKSKPKHFDQMSGYGEKLGNEHAIYMPENKNDDDIKVEVVKLDWNRGRQLEVKAGEIILAKEPPPKISESPAFSECRWCNFKGICHDDEPIVEKNCRSCRLSTPVAEGRWFCTRFNDNIPEAFIIKGCDGWTPI